MEFTSPFWPLPVQAAVLMVVLMVVLLALGGGALLFYIRKARARHRAARPEPLATPAPEGQGANAPYGEEIKHFSRVIAGMEREWIRQSLNGSLYATISKALQHLNELLQQEGQGAVAAPGQENRALVALRAQYIEQVATQLNPEQLQQKVLIACLADFFQAWGNGGVQVGFQGHEPPAGYPTHVKFGLFRALSSLVMHALYRHTASTVMVSFEVNDQTVVVEYADNDSTINALDVAMVPEQLKDDLFVLFEEVLASFGASVRYDIHYTRGLRLVVEAPLSPTAPTPPVKAQPGRRSNRFRLSLPFSFLFLDRLG